MKIVINPFDKKSLNNAVLELNKIADTLDKMLIDFFTLCCEWFISQTKNYLAIKDIGEEVKEGINKHWTYTVTSKGATLVNNDDKAVFVEFGVGKVGQEKPHTNANKTTYQYNIGKKIKEDGSWIFNVNNDENIDIQAKFIDNRTEHTVRTHGSPAVMYAYNSLLDLERHYVKLWEDVKRKYWG